MTTESTLTADAPAEDVTGGHEANVDLAKADALAITDRLARLRPVAAGHDR